MPRTRAFTGADRRRHRHPRTTCGGGRPSDPRPLGRHLLSGGKNSYVATLVERLSRFLMLIKVPSKDTAVVVAALSKHVRKLPATLRRSLTWDRGLEMAKHKEFTVETDVQKVTLKWFAPHWKPAHWATFTNLVSEMI